MDFIDFGLWLTFALIVFGVASALFFSILNLFSNPKQAKGVVFSFVGMGLVVLIAFLIADGSVMGNTDVSAGTAKKVGAGLITLYLLMLGAVGTIIGSEITKLFK